MKLFKKQAQSIVDSTKFLNFWVGPVRSGKTIASIIRWIQYVAAYKGTADLVMVGRTQQTLYRNVIRIIEGYVGKKNCFYSSAKNEFRLFNNICYIIGANDERSEGKIRGLTAGGAYGDEIVLWPFNCLQMLVGRLSETGASGFFTTNPDSPFHQVKTEYIDKAIEHESIVFNFDFDDNIFLGEDFKRRLKAIYTGLWYKRYILGQWCIAEGAIVDFFDEDEHVITKYPEAEYYTLAIDYGANNPFGALLLGNNSSSKPRIWARWECYHDPSKHGTMTNHDYKELLVKFCRDHLGKEWRTMIRRTFLDPSAESFQIELEQALFPGVTHADNSVLDGILFVCSLMKLGHYAISEDCPNYIREIMGYLWDAKKQKLGIDAPIKVNDHLFDAGRYGVYSELGGSQVDFYSLTKW